MEAQDSHTWNSFEPSKTSTLTMLDLDTTACLSMPMSMPAMWFPCLPRRWGSFGLGSGFGCPRCPADATLVVAGAGACAATSSAGDGEATSAVAASLDHAPWKH